jgi:hypothetical protein
MIESKIWSAASWEYSCLRMIHDSVFFIIALYTPTAIFLMIEEERCSKRTHQSTYRYSSSWKLWWAQDTCLGSTSHRQINFLISDIYHQEYSSVRSLSMSSMFLTPIAIQSIDSINRFNQSIQSIAIIFDRVIDVLEYQSIAPSSDSIRFDSFHVQLSVIVTMIAMMIFLSWWHSHDTSEISLDTVITSPNSEYPPNSERECVVCDLKAYDDSGAPITITITITINVNYSLMILGSVAGIGTASSS